MADARALIDEHLRTAPGHLLMIEELVEQGFSKFIADRVAEQCVKQQASDGFWWWAREDTPRDTFVEVDGNLGTARACARSGPQDGEETPKTP